MSFPNCGSSAILLMGPGRPGSANAGRAIHGGSGAMRGWTRMVLGLVLLVGGVAPPAAFAQEPSVTIDPTSLSVPKGGSADYTVTLNTEPPAGSLTINVTPGAGDAGLTATPSMLTFTSIGSMTVTVRSADGGPLGTRTFEHTAGSGGEGDNWTFDEVVATEFVNLSPTFESPREFEVAENETAVGTVVAMDSDNRIIDFTLLNRFHDGNRFDITDVDFGASAGTFTLMFKEAPDFEFPTDADKDNVYVVIVEAISGTGERARPATQTIEVTVTNQIEAPSAPPVPTVSAETASSLTVTWEAPANTGPAITDYDVQYRAGTSGAWSDARHSGTALTTTLTGLMAGTSYQIQVRATNDEGTGAWSAPATGTTNVAPTFTSGATFSVVENETEVGTVVAMDADTGDSITGYAIAGGADRAKFSITNAGALTFTSAPNYESPTDADTDNVYVVEVEATGGAAGRELTATQTITVTVTDQSEAPSAPSAPTVSGETASRLTVSWTEPANTGPAITDYDVQYRAGTRGAWTDARHSGTALTATLTGLMAGTSYQIQVRASNAEGTSAWSDTTTGMTVPNVAPTFTSGATFSVVENEMDVDTVVATDADAGDSITGYAIAGGADRAKFSITNAGALTFTSAPDYESPTDADSDNVYVVEVEATGGAAGRELTATQTITVTVTDQSEAPSAPSAPTVSGETASRLTVTWTEPANTGPAITDYDVQYRAGTSGAWTDARHSGTALIATLTGLMAGTSYQIQVRASNAEGTGMWSASATGMTVPNVAPTFTSGATFSVVENEMDVDTVVATDADAGDSITGYAIAGGADRAKFSITNAGALTFTSAPDYESPTDADSDNVYVVEVEATGGAAERELTATQTITVTVTNQSEAPSAPDPTVSAEEASSLTVNWEAPANTGPAITDYDVQYRAGTSGAWTDAGHSGTGRTITLTGLTANTNYEVEVRASNAEGTSAWSDPATGTTTATPGRMKRAMETVESEVLRAMVSETLDVVTQRMERPRDGEAQASLGGRSSLSELLQSQETALSGEAELDWERVLGTSSFSLPLSETDQPGAGGGLEVWGRGAWRSLSGGSAQDMTWDGEVLSAHLGADWRPRSELLAGAALSWHKSAVGYDVVDGGKRFEGTLRNRMTSVHPYLGWFPSEGSSLWMSVGYGRGTVEVDDDEEGRQSGDSDTRMVGAGGRVRVLSSEGWLGGGTSSLDVKGEGWMARKEVSSNGALLADLDVDVQRIRLALEGTHERRLASGSVLTPVLELGVRHDEGDGETGVGVEMSAGLRYADAQAGLSSEVRVRGLAAHQGAVEEWGVGGTVHYAPGASGRGVSFSVTSSLGAPENGTERLWEQSVSDSLAVVEDDKATTSALRLESELGYGFSALSGAGVLTPYGGFTFSEENARRYRMGVRLERSPALRLELESERSETTTDTDHGIFLKGALRW